MKQTILVLAVLCSFLSCSLAQKEKATSFSQTQIMAFYEKMIEQIEEIDAEAIVTRNENKKVSWEQYKEYHKTQFQTAKTDQEFKAKFHAFARGFSNAHSRFDFLYPVQEKSQTHKTSSIKIGYTFPEMSFFDLNSKKTITEINEKPINEVFEHFENYETSANTTLRSQRYFKRCFEAGKLFVEDELAKTITFEDGNQLKIKYVESEKTKSPISNHGEGIKIRHYTDWEQVAVGYKVALLQKENVALIKIKNFSYPNRSSTDLRCEQTNVEDSTQCADVKILRKALRSIEQEVDYLIFDLQNNGGGNENSFFLAEFCPKAFTDIPVAYRKTLLLEMDDVRDFLFYGSIRAEKWFQELKQSGVYEATKEGDFLPVRADFCRGAENCALKPIEPNDPNAYHFKKYYVLINEGTASASDDFVYRMKRSANAIIAGQPQAADLTYGVANMLFLMDEKGEIKMMYDYGKSDDTAIAEITIPNSRSLDENGKLLQGNPLPLDIPVNLTKKNFEKREESVLEAVLKDIEKN